MNLASSAYRIVSIGYESNVKAYKSSWETSDKGKKYQSNVVHGIDSLLVYADIVLLSYAETLVPYQNTLAWYQACTGKSRIAAKELKPQGDMARISKIRVYWYPDTSYGYDQQNIGMYQLLSGIKVPDSDTEKFRALLDRGSKDPSVAFRVLSKVKSMHDAKHAVEGHLTALVFTKHDNHLGRTIISGIKPGTSYRWLAGTAHNRSKHKWVEDIHGKAIDLYLGYLDNQMGSDAVSMDSLYDEVASEELGEITQISPTADTAVFVPEGAVKLATPSKLIAACWDLQGEFGELRLPDGSVITEEDPRWSMMCKAYRAQEANNKEPI